MYDKHMFPQVAAIPPAKNRAGYEKKCVFHEKLLYHYLIRKIKGWSVRDFFGAERIDGYALYAVTDFTLLFLNDLDENPGKNRIEVICDKNAGNYRTGFEERKVILPEQLVSLYESRRIKKIIVMSILHENEIIDELLKMGILLNDIISFVSILYS